MHNAANKQAYTYPEHDCFGFQRRHYVLTRGYTAETCGTSNRIIGFRWRSIWARIRSLWTDRATHITKEQF